MSRTYPPRKFDNRIMFRASPETLAALVAFGEQQGTSPSVIARRILEEKFDPGPIRQALDLVVDRLLVIDELIRIMMSEFEQERVGEAEYIARLRAIDPMPPRRK